ARVVLRDGRPTPGALLEDAVELFLGAGRGDDPGEVLGAAARTLARIRGGARLDEAFDRVVRGRGREEGLELLARADPDALRDRIEDLEGTPRRLREREARLRELRADHAELAGDVEVATMEWLRERQDAETHLQAYRDRARELKARLTQLEDAGPEAPCPTCGRVLESHFDDVVTELREEWESVVQDGSWWKRRREQLELKPEALQELEGRSLRLQAAMEECAEQVERERTRDHELRSARERLRTLEAGAAPAADDDGEEDPAPELLRTMGALKERLVESARADILEVATRIVLDISGGRLLGMTPRGDVSLELQGVGARLADPTQEDRAAAVVAIRLGAARTVMAEGVPAPGTLVLGPPFDRMDEESRLRTVEYLSGLRGRLPQILIVTRGRIVELCPEVFDAVLELGVDGAGGGSVVRSLAAGVGTVRLT
ncbi:MAG TPA: hypothetical protein VLL48_02490, partial [Longimicrobiales bacterium]|nr:hypothetical protein [Longimicrobiales bacterium]